MTRSAIGQNADMVSTRQRSDDAAAHIRDLIVSGEVAPGAFLRLEPIAQDLGISVTPVREAMVLLRGEGFVELEPRRGFVVLAMSRADIEDNYRVHAFVSGELAALACRRLSAESLDRIVTIQHELERAHTTGSESLVADLNHAFHREINLAADSRRLLWFLRASARYAPRLFFARIEGWSEASAHDHQAVLVALAVRDADGARRAMREHVSHAGELLARHRGTL